MSQTGVRVLNLAGDAVVELASGLEKVFDVKRAVQSERGTPPALQRILLDGTELADGDELAPLLEGGASILNLTYVRDESPLYSWDLTGNPDSALLSGNNQCVEYTSERWDYVNVITQEPVRSGAFHFEFVMHGIGDEQWCGVSTSKSRAGHSGGSATGWYYYCGRRRGDHGELHARRERRSIARFAHVKSGDRIGLLLRWEQGLLAFSMNGQLQGACRVPNKPLYLSTVLDEKGDSVELRRLPLEDFPGEGSDNVLVEDEESEDESLSSGLTNSEMAVPEFDSDMSGLSRNSD